MSTFIRVIEVWTPTADGSLLELSSALTGNTTSFGAVSRSMCFGRGEGLPGRAWDGGRPIILKDLQTPYFRRAKAAAAEGLTCAIAMPFFAGRALTSVMLIFCGDDVGHVGAIEQWRNVAADGVDMTWVDGYYGGTAEVFEFLSRHMTFRRGFGLPGIAWDSAAPVFMADLGKGTRFLRSDSAQQVGINRGFALPCSTPGPDTDVMVFLSALATPIVRRFETWRPDARSHVLHRSEGFCETTGVLDVGADGDRVLRGEGALGECLSTCRPVLAARAVDQPGAVGRAAGAAGLSTFAAVPVIHERRVSAVVGWYF